MIVQSPRLLGDPRPFSSRSENLGQAGFPGPPRCALSPCLPVSPTMSGVRWSMRSWESVRPRRSRRQGVPRSHGPAEESIYGTNINFQLTARCLTTQFEGWARTSPTSQLNPATWVRWLATPCAARAGSPTTSQLDPGHLGSASRATATASDDRRMKLCMRTV
jgi:hypothetical protein